MWTSKIEKTLIFEMIVMGNAKKVKWLKDKKRELWRHWDLMS